MDDTTNKPTDHWVRDTLVEDAINKFRSQGHDLPADDVARIIKEDLRLVDQYNATAKKAPAPKRDKKQRRSVALKDLMASQSTGGHHVTTVVRPQQISAAKGCTCGACRACKMTKRQRILMQKYPLQRVVDKQGCINWHAFMFPAYAKETWSLMSDYQQCKGKFRGKNKTDRDSMVVRLMEDICDRSNALLGLGNWWCK